MRSPIEPSLFKPFEADTGMAQKPFRLTNYSHAVGDPFAGGDIDDYPRHLSHRLVYDCLAKSIRRTY
ncbi:hypothetical protein PHJA_000263400 [Phtheirospermum japonicum]|uniref:Uncharacterized protein n=1 Tax=Phtheirospermum japonicum TaxID=374723 RepID=A0A830BGQ1_9LAMI|nr:hypothetical protein PHJA_000263400 [Phtheirospermum japonicum]